MFLYVISLVTFTSCKNNPGKDETAERVEDLQAKQTIQGIWIDEDEGSVAFCVKGDTIFYADSLSEPVCFHIYVDTLYLESSRPVSYKLLKLNKKILKFVNSDGDEVRLLKSTNKDDSIKFFNIAKESVTLNQGVLIKRDTILTSGSKRYHAYVQVNPTSYKVFRQVMNDDGVMVDNAYYDNIVHVALYDGGKALINRDFRKQDFSKQVPADYIKGSILSDIVVDKVSESSVTFVAYLTTPDSYTSYNVRIHVTVDGKYNMSVE